jgi:hypothetical protein
MRRLDSGYLVPVLDCFLVRECAAGSHPPAADRNASVCGDVGFVAQPRLGGSLQISPHPLRRPLSLIDAWAP